MKAEEDPNSSIYINSVRFELEAEDLTSEEKITKLAEEVDSLKEDLNIKAKIIESIKKTNQNL